MPPAGPAPRLADHRDVPILINSYNRLHGLARLVAWLLAAGQRRIVILDNQSTYPPVMAYLRRIERQAEVRVVRLGDNLGHLGLWTHGLLSKLGIETEYVYTDPDIVPSGGCPANLVARLQGVLRDEPSIHKVGPALRLDDLPDHYALKTKVLAWEAQFWTRPAAPGLFFAAIDTTFALYRAGGGPGLDAPSLRTGWPFVARHLGWYADSRSPSEEDAYYARAIRPGISCWSAKSCPPDFAAAIASQAGPPSLLLLWPRQTVPPHGYAVARADVPNRQAAPLDGILVDQMRGPLPWAKLAAAARPGALLVMRCPLDRLGSLLAGEARGRTRWLRREQGIGADWTLRRVTVVQTEPREAILHLVRQTACDRPAGIVSWQRSRLDRSAAFGVPPAAGP
jgi:hypothetical protein